MFLKTSGGAVSRLPLPGCSPDHTSLHGISDNGSFCTSVTAIGSSINFSCCYLHQGFITLSARVNEILADIRTWAILMMLIRDPDQRVPPSIDEIVTAVQQIVVFVVWRIFFVVWASYFDSLLGCTRSRGRCWAAIQLSHNQEHSGSAVHGEVDGSDIRGQHDGLFLCITPAGCRGGHTPFVQARRMKAIWFCVLVLNVYWMNGAFFYLPY